MRANRSKNTSPEIAVRISLRKNGYGGYRLHWKKAPGRPDIGFPGRKVAIFVNGCFWHRCPICKPHLPKSNTRFWKNKFDANVLRDKRKIEELKVARWKVFVVWECRIKYNSDSSITPIINYLSSLS